MPVCVLGGPTFFGVRCPTFFKYNSCCFPKIDPAGCLEVGLTCGLYHMTVQMQDVESASHMATGLLMCAAARPPTHGVAVWAKDAALCASACRRGRSR